MSEKTVSLVLGSGGARGLAHIGIIEWLEQHGFDMRVMGEGLARIIWILDPCGNIVELQQDPNLSTA